MSGRNSGQVDRDSFDQINDKIGSGKFLKQ